jgi:hypothetical protein
LNCGYPGHLVCDCTFDFNPNRVQLQQKNSKKKNDKKRPFGKSQPLRTDDDFRQTEPGEVEELDSEDDDYSDSEYPAAKRQKN